MDIRDLISVEVLERGVADIILDYQEDLEEIVMNTNVPVHIRKTGERTYKIYNSAYPEYILRTINDYSMERMKNNNDFFIEFCKEFMCNHIYFNELHNPLRNFVLEILLEMVLYSFHKDKNSLVHFIELEMIEDYVNLGINDGIEDLIYQAQFNGNIRNRYIDYDFNYQFHEVVDEYENENEDIFDVVAYNQYRREVQLELNENDNMFVDNNNIMEIERFKYYLNQRGELIIIEDIALSYFLQRFIFEYERDYDNFIRYSIGWDRIDTTDDELA